MATSWGSVSCGRLRGVVGRLKPRRLSARRGRCVSLAVFLVWMFSLNQLLLRPILSVNEDVVLSEEPVRETAPREWRWQLVPGRELAVYAAYLDYGEDPSSAKQVLVTAVLNMTETRPLYCHFVSDHSLPRSVTTVGPISARFLGHWYPEHGKTVLLRCPISNGTSSPVAVRLSGQAEGPPSGGDEQWVAVSSVPDKTLKAVWCLGPLYDRYDEVQILVEQLEWAKLQGIGEVIAYVDSVAPQVMAVLRHYEKEGLVRVIDWNIAHLVNRDVYYLGQLGLLNDCVYRNKHRAQYVFLHDVDERLIVPHQLHVMDQIESIFKAPSTAAAVVRSAFYRRAPKGSRILMHSRMKSSFYPHGVRSKVIVRPRFIDATDVHDVDAVSVGYQRVAVGENELFLAHFRFETIDIGYSGDELLPDYVDVMSPLVAAKMELLAPSAPMNTT